MSEDREQRETPGDFINPEQLFEMYKKAMSEREKHRIGDGALPLDAREWNDSQWAMMLGLLTTIACHCEGGDVDQGMSAFIEAFKGMRAVPVPLVEFMKKKAQDMIKEPSDSATVLYGLLTRTVAVNQAIRHQAMENIVNDAFSEISFDES